MSFLEDLKKSIDEMSDDELKLNLDKMRRHAISVREDKASSKRAQPKKNQAAEIVMPNPAAMSAEERERFLKELTNDS